MTNQNKFSESFLNSILGIGESVNSTKDLIKWISFVRNNTIVKIKRVNFDELKQWKFIEKKGVLKHHSGKFFSIQGLLCSNSWTNLSWEQPIINQPEIGYLGILCKEINGVLHFLLQTKIEPGNKNYVQLSPTLQATRSNFTSVHGGKKPEYLKYFKNSTNQEVIVDCLQSEQGSRFYKKRNRNIIIKINHEIEIKENFKWVTLSQIKDLLKKDNIINMDTRSVISCINITKYITAASETHSINGNEFFKSIIEEEESKTELVLNKFIDFKFNLETKNKIIPLNKINNWEIKKDKIGHVNKKYFEVIANKIEIDSREVICWDQPMIKPIGKGYCILFIKKINNIVYLLSQIKSEPGIFDLVELAPTIQTNNLENYSKDKIIKFYLNSKNKFSIIHESYQSEEGGRFYKEDNKNIIIKLFDKNSFNDLPINYCWISLSDALFINSTNHLFNIQLRSLISLIDYKKIIK